MLLSFVARKVGKTLLNKRSMSFAQRKALQKAQAASAAARRSNKMATNISNNWSAARKQNLANLKVVKKLIKSGVKHPELIGDKKRLTSGMARNAKQYAQLKKYQKSILKETKKTDSVQSIMEKNLTKNYGSGMVKAASLAPKGNPQVRAAKYVAAGLAAGGAVEASERRRISQRADRKIEAFSHYPYQTKLLSSLSSTQAEAAKLTAKYKKLTKGIA